MKKILIDARSLQTYSKYRGIGRHTKQIINLFKDDERFRFLFFEGDDVPKDLKRTIEIKYPRKFITFTDKFFLNNYLRKEKISVYHSPAYGLPGKQKEIDFFLTVHDITPLLFPKLYSFKIKFILKTIIKSSKTAKNLIVDSKATKNSILNYFAEIKDEKIKVIYPMIEPDICFSIKKPSVNIPSQYLLYTGGFDRIKNIETIIKSVNVLKIPIVFVGKIDENRKKELMRGLKESEKKMFVFTGFVRDEELSYLYRNASLFIFLSLNEGFGYPPLEALNCGTLPLLSDRGSLKEVVGDCGIYIDDPFNIDEIVYKTKFILENDDVKNKLLLKRGKILKKYSPERFKKELIDIYDIK